MGKYVAIGLLVLVIILGVVFKGQYNSLVELDESANKTWSNVETEYQRRFDLIPSIVETVKGYADFEKSTLTAVTEARAKAMAAMQGTNGGKNLGEFNQANTSMVGAMRGMFGYTENYPELKASELFKDLQRQLEGTENRIATSRERYNDSIEQYNVTVRKFPMMMVAGMFGFDQREQFNAVEGSEVAPKVEFTK